MWSPRRPALECAAHLRFLQLRVTERRADVPMPQHTLHELAALALCDQLTAAGMA